MFLIHCAVCKLCHVYIMNLQPTSPCVTGSVYTLYILKNSDKNGAASAHSTPQNVIQFSLFLRHFLRGRATAGIAITQQAILRFFATHGRHDSRTH